MRLPSSPDEKPERPRDPSYPDRARIDSDVREFMRQPSTPWIVFDKDSRVDRNELAPTSFAAEAGGILPLAKTPLPERALFPPEIANAPVPPVVEPSSLVVAADVLDEPKHLAPLPELAVRSPRALIAGAIAGAIGLVAVIACVIGGATQPMAKSAHAATNANGKGSVPAEPSPPNLDLPPPVTDDAITTTPPPPEPPTAQDKPESKAAPGSPASTNVPDLSSTDPKKKFGRLTIKGAATGKQVFLDGKRLLGSGQRTFTVFCGDHTIAINDKNETRDVVIPCNGDLTIAR